MHRDMLKIQDGVAIVEKLNCKFTEHVKNMLYSANNSLYVIRSLRKEGLC